MWEDELAGRIEKGLLLCKAKRGLDRAEISSRLGFETESSLSKWAKGQATPGPENIAKLCDATGLSPAYLLLGREPAFQGDRAMQVEVIGMVVDGQVDPTAMKRFAEKIRGRALDDAETQAELEAFVRGFAKPDADPAPSDGPEHSDSPEHRSTDDGNDSPGSSHRAGP